MSLSRPFIRAKVSVAHMMWFTILALLPAAGISIYAFGEGACRTLLLSLFSALISEAIARFFLRRPVMLENGSAFLTGLLVALLLPPGAPWWLPVLGSFFATWIGKELVGGLGSYFFNPALLAWAFLCLVFPTHMTRWLLPFEAARLMILLNITLLLAGLALIYLRIIPWRMPFYYLGISLFITHFLEGHSLHEVLGRGMILWAFFYLTDFSSSPTTEPGRVIFVMASALVALGLRAGSSRLGAENYGILLMNAVTPIIDRYLRPRVLGEGKTKSSWSFFSLV